MTSTSFVLFQLFINPRFEVEKVHIMKFKKRNLVEVLRRGNQPCGSWFVSKLVSTAGDSCIVRYKLFVDHDGAQIVEKVPREDVRPQPPNEKGKRWMTGDIAEVFDIHSWRVGTVAKVLKNNRVLVRLFGSIPLKEFHKSKLRIRQVWHNNKWSVIGKVGRNKQIANPLAQVDSRYASSLDCMAQKRSCEETLSREKGGQKDLRKDRSDHFKRVIPGGTTERIHAYCSEPSSNDLLMGGSFKKRKSTLDAEGCDKPLMENLLLFKQVDNNSTSKVRVAEKCMNEYTQVNATTMGKTASYTLHSFRPLLSTEESDQCSIASCSYNEDTDHSGQNFRKPLEDTFDSSDAESSFPSFPSKSRENHLSPSHRDKLEVDIHKLELSAYESTVQALYASGPLSWEQQSLLTNLRLSLHISDEEHLLQLRYLLSSQFLRQFIVAAELVSKELFLEIQRQYFAGIVLIVWGLGWQDRRRKSWAAYYRETHAVIVVMIDSTDIARISIIKDQLFTLLQHEDLEGQRRHASS